MSEQVTHYMHAYCATWHDNHFVLVCPWNIMHHMYWKCLQWSLCREDQLWHIRPVGSKFGLVWWGQVKFSGRGQGSKTITRRVWGPMLPQENFVILGILRSFLVQYWPGKCLARKQHSAITLIGTEDVAVMCTTRLVSFPCCKWDYMAPTVGAILFLVHQTLVRQLPDLPDLFLWPCIIMSELSSTHAV